MALPRADLFRLLGDEDRLRLLALCAEEELTVGELAELIGESQPQVTKKSQPLREAGLLAARRDGTRTLLKSEGPTRGSTANSAEGHRSNIDPPPHSLTGSAAHPGGAGVFDPPPHSLTGSAAHPGRAGVFDLIVAEAIAEGRRLCGRDGSLAKVARVVAQREELSRQLFEQPHSDAPAPVADVTPFMQWLPMFAPLLPGRALAVDAGTGEGELLPMLALLYDRVVAVDRSASRLARCALRIESFRLGNVRLREGSIDDASLAEEVRARGGADLVVIARVLHHIGKPQELIAAATQLLRSGGHLAVIDYLPHADESLRERGHVWLGFEPEKLHNWLAQSSLAPIAATTLPADHHPPLQLAIGQKPMRAP